VLRPGTMLREREKQRAGPLDLPPGTAQLWRSDGDYTLFGAAVDRFRFRIGLSVWRW